MNLEVTAHFFYVYNLKNLNFTNYMYMYNVEIYRLGFWPTNRLANWLPRSRLVMSVNHFQISLQKASHL